VKSIITFILISFSLASCWCTGAFVTKEQLDENTKLVKSFCNKNKKELGVNISNQDSLIAYTIFKNDCSKVVKSTIKYNRIRAGFNLSDKDIYYPLNKYDTIIIKRLIHLSDSLGWCNDALKNGKSLMGISKK